MAAKWIEVLTGPLEQKKQYRQAKARLDALPEPHRTAAAAVSRYLLVYGGAVDGDTVVQMVVDHADLWEQAAAERTPVRAIVGDDPVEYAETFAQAYAARTWLDKERQRLVAAIDDLPGGTGGAP